MHVCEVISNVGDHSPGLLPHLHVEERSSCVWPANLKKIALDVALDCEDHHCPAKDGSPADHEARPIIGRHPFMLKFPQG